MKKLFYLFSIITTFIPFLVNAECLISFSVRQICPFRASDNDFFCLASSSVALQETSGAYFCAPDDTFSRCILTSTGFGVECSTLSQEECNNLSYCHWKS